MSKSTSPDTPRPESVRYPFPKSVRLHRSSDFARVREHGRSVQARLIRVGCFKLADQRPSRVGIITSRRVGGAVVRNRVRRRLRELVRHTLPQIPVGWHLVIVAKSAAATAMMEELHAEWLLLGRRLSIFPPSL